MKTQRAIVRSVVAWLAISVGGGGTAFGHINIDAYWSGADGSDWMDSNNWESEYEPCDELLDIIVYPTASSFYPVLSQDCLVRSVTVASDADLTLAGAVTMEVWGNLSLGGSLNLAGSSDGAELRLGAAAVLSGDGTMFVGPSLENRVGTHLPSNSVLTNGLTSHLTIVPHESVGPGQVGFVQIGDNYSRIKNFGTIDARGNVAVELWFSSEASYQQISRNHGTLKASEGAELVLEGEYFPILDSQIGQIVAHDNSRVVLRNLTVQTPTFVTDGTGIILIPDNAEVMLAGSVQLDGVLELGAIANESSLMFWGDATVHGTGAIASTSSNENAVGGSYEFDEEQDQLTIAEDAHVSLIPSPSIDAGSVARLQFGDDDLLITVNGILEATGSTYVTFKPAQATVNGSVRITDGGVVAVSGVQIDGTGVFDVAGGFLIVEQGDTGSLPDVSVTQAGTFWLNVTGRTHVQHLSLDATSTLKLASGSWLTVNGGLSYAMSGGDGWEVVGGTVKMAGDGGSSCDPSSYVSLEAGGPDYMIPKLIISSGAIARLVDEFENSADGLPDALYVETLVFEDESARLDLGGIELVAGTIEGASPCSFMECVEMVGSEPPDGAIDARQPFELEGGDAQGWTSFDMTFCASAAQVAMSDFAIEEIGGDGVAPGIVSLEAINDDVARITLDAPIEPMAWTRVTYLPQGATVQVGFLPGDSDGNGVASAADLLHLVDCLTASEGCPSYSTDIDRSGEAGPADVLRAVDLLNGTGAYDAYIGSSLGEL